MDPTANIPQDSTAFMALVWSLCATFVNGRKPGSVTIHFGADGRFASWEQKAVGKF